MEKLNCFSSLDCCAPSAPPKMADPLPTPFLEITNKLMDNYKPKFMWWELLVIVRKLILTVSFFLSFSFFYFINNQLLGVIIIDESRYSSISW